MSEANLTRRVTGGGRLEQARAAVRRSGCAGWLFYNVYHRDQIADAVFGIRADTSNTRPWLAVVPADGPVLKLVHEIEARVLDHVDGDTHRYASRSGFAELLTHLAPPGSVLAAQCSQTLPRLSTLDHGTAGLLERAGFTLQPSEDLVQWTLGGLSGAQLASHDRAAEALHRIVADSWQHLAGACAAGRQVTEGEVRDWILAALDERGLITDHAPIVAFGANSADPHYSASGAGAVLDPGAVVQLDLWCKEPEPGAVYADISWVGVAASRPTARQRETFEAVRAARERAVSFLADAAASGRPVSGSEVDQECRQVLADRGLISAVRHRTGHSIDTDLHGSGVNLDSFEFPDGRPVTEGACFSVEPGVYFPAEFGMRTEIDVSIRCGRPVAPGGAAQQALLTLNRDSGAVNGIRTDS